MRKVRELLRSPLAVSFISSGIVFLATVGLRSAGSLEALELAAYDWFIRLQPKQVSSNPHIALIEITEDDIQRCGHWPMTDATLAQALAVLTKYGARAIGLDIFRDLPVPPGREQLEAILSTNPHITTVMKFGYGGIPPPNGVQHLEQIAFNDILVDPGGTVRRGLLFLDDGERVSYSLALRLALTGLQMEGMALQPDVSQPEHVTLGPTSVPPFEPDDGGYVHADARGYQFLIDFKDDPGAFLSFSLTSLLSDEIDAGVIDHKIVLIGVTAQSVKDFFFTPYSRSLAPDQKVSGIALHAHMVSQLLRWSRGESQPMGTVGKELEAFWIFLWCVMGGAVGLWIRSPWRFTIVSLGALFVLGFTDYLAFLNAWWIPLAPPALGWLGSATVVTAYISSYEKRERASLMRIFSRYVSPKLAETIWQEREQFVDGGRPRSQGLVETVLFSDLKGFTPIGEKMDPQTLTDWLNTYLEPMAQLVMEYDGFVDDYAGDGIKADFGVPLPRTTDDGIRQDAVSAVKCALVMEQEICRMNKLWQGRGLPTVRLRIGINTGPVVAGAIGNRQRLKYTTIGNTVNIASRLESYDKDSFDLESESSCRILIGEATLHYVGSDFASIKVGEVMLKGLSQPIGVYRILGPKSQNLESTLSEHPS